MSAPRNRQPSRLTVDQVAARLGISRSGVYRLFRSRKLAAIHPTPGRTYVLEVEVERYEAGLIREAEAGRARRAL